MNEHEMDGEEPVAARCDDISLHVKLTDGREITVPLWWYPTLLNASRSQRQNIELSYSGLHWPDIDEDLSIRGILAGQKYPFAEPPVGTKE